MPPAGGPGAIASAYLRRRPRHAPSTANAPAARAVHGEPPRRTTGRLLLTPEVTEVTLDRRQSAIGSLTFELAGQGEIGVVWELEDSTTGLVSPLEGRLVSPEFGRRPIVEHRQGQVVVGLRHVRAVRRLLVLIESPPTRHPHRLVGTLYGDDMFESSFSGEGPVTAALAVYQVRGELVVRREGFEFPSRADAADAYGFHATWIPTHRGT